MFIPPRGKADATIKLPSALTHQQITELGVQANNAGHILTAVGKADYKVYYGARCETTFAVYFFGRSGRMKMLLPKGNGGN